MKELEVVGQVRNKLRPRPKHLRKPSSTPEEEVWDLFVQVSTETIRRFGTSRPAFQAGTGIGNHTLMDERMESAKLTNAWKRVRPLAQQMLEVENGASHQAV